jgi:hemerythrin superfamily protein
MATSTKSTTRKPPRRREAVTPDAIAILKEDHKRVDALFQRFDKLKENGEAKLTLVHQICKELTIHARVEEEIFYPPVRDAIHDDDLMDEADVEHASAKALIAELMQMEPGDDHYDAKVRVLGEYVRHHVKEEQQEMFKKVRSAKVDLKALGAIETSGDVGRRRIVAAATA